MTQNLQPDEEQALIESSKADPEAFRGLYRHYFPRIYAYTAARVGRKEDAEDIVSGIFVKVVEALERFEYRGAGSFAAWVFRIAHNEVKQFYRQQKRNGEPLALDDVPPVHSNMPPPDQIYQDKERLHELQAMIATLSPRRQEIISLRFFGGLRNQEIAVVLGLNEKTVASHLSRGLDDLQRKYAHEATETESSA